MYLCSSSNAQIVAWAGSKLIFHVSCSTAMAPCIYSCIFSGGCDLCLAQQWTLLFAPNAAMMHCTKCLLR